MVEISERTLRLAKEGGWIGVDLDGTTFTYGDWVAWNIFGEVIAPMRDRIWAWTRAGVLVRIVTARIGLPHTVFPNGLLVYSTEKKNTCVVTGEKYSDFDMQKAIQRHCLHHSIPKLPVQCFKDYHMIELWDDRAIQVIANTGQTLAEEHAAQMAALRGRQFQGEPR